MSIIRDECSTSVGIASIAYTFPPKKMLVEDIVQNEKIANASKFDSDIGIEQVYVFEGEWRSELALLSAKECLSRAELKAEQIDVIIDFSVMPQDYVVPSWCMSNQIQHQLGARNAFNLGFGGGGSTNLLVALRFASSLIQADEEVKTALLIATDVAIPGNRIINPDNPLTVLGDGASALILTEGKGVCEIIRTNLLSEGKQHDVLSIPGGGLAFPDRLDLYHLEVSQKKYSQEAAFIQLKKVVSHVARRSGVEIEDIAHFIGTNISQRDQAKLTETFGVSNRYPYRENRRQYGHVQATDLVVNLSQFIEGRGAHERDFGVICSHGWGFLSGATLINC